jgi:hypothetical protein
MTGPLRAALGSDEETPAGVHLPAVRARARRLRRRRRAVGAAAVLAVAAVLVPTVLLRPPPEAPLGRGPVPALGCPDRVPPEPASVTAGRLVPFRPTTGLVCGYEPGPDGRGGLLGVVTPLTAAQARTLGQAADAAKAMRSTTACPLNLGPAYAVQLAGPGGRVTLRVEPYSCGFVSDGTHTRLAAGAFAKVLGDVPVYANCPEEPLAPAGPAGGPLLPPRPLRLLVCGYQPGHEVGRRWEPVVVPARDAAKYAAEVDASPRVPLPAACTDEVAPVVVVTAVTPTGSVRLRGEVGNCRYLTDGTRAVRNEALVRSLWALSQP